MGVPGLQTWLKRRYGDAFVALPDIPFDHVYIDMSSTLHQVIRRGMWCVMAAAASMRWRRQCEAYAVQDLPACLLFLTSCLLLAMPCIPPALVE